MRMSKSSGWKMAFVREWRRIVSRPIYVIMTIILPLGFLFFYSTFLQEGFPEQLPLGVIDHDNSSLSRTIIRQIDATQQTKVAATYLHFSEAKKSIQRGEIYAFLEIPAHLQKDVYSGNQPTIHYYYNQSYFVAGSLLLRDMEIMLNTISSGVNLQTRQLKGQGVEESMAQILPIVPEIHAIGNPYMNYSVYLSNVLLPGMLQLMILLTIVYCIGIELKKSSSKVWLRGAKGSLFQAMIGKLLPYTLIFSCIGLFYELFLFKFMHFPLYNSLWWMVLDTFLLVIGTEAVAIVMIGIVPVLRDGLCFAGLYGILAFSYSGLVFPIEGMPVALQGLSYLFPLRFFFKIFQNVVLNDVNPTLSLIYYFIMLLFLLLPLVVWKRLHGALVKLDYPKK